MLRCIDIFRWLILWCYIKANILIFCIFLRTFRILFANMLRFELSPLSNGLQIQFKFLSFLRTLNLVSRIQNFVVLTVF